MLKLLAKRSIESFGRKWNYDVSYMTEILDEAGVDAVAPLGALGKLKYRKDVPVSVYHAATVTAAIAADCGPCAQLTVSMAEADGVATETLRALARGDRNGLSVEDRLGFDLAHATTAREPAPDVQAEIVRRWGKRALVSLAYGIVVAGAYPTFKYAIGHGHACTRLRVAGKDVARALNVVA